MCCKMRICRLEISYDGAPPYFLLAFRGILEQLVSETVDGTRCTNSTACSFPWFKSLKLSSLVKSKIYSLWYSSQWRPALATTNRMCLRWALRSWNFSASQAVTVHTCNILRWDIGWTLSGFSLSSGDRNSKTKLQKAYFHNFFVLWSRFTSSGNGHMFSLTLYTGVLISP
jgi:hypothetical protein